MGENFFFWNYGVTKLHHIPLVELNFNKIKSEKRAGIFRYKPVLYNVDSRYSCTNNVKRIPSEKPTQQATDSLSCEKSLENKRDPYSGCGYGF